MAMQERDHVIAQNMRKAKRFNCRTIQRQRLYSRTVISFIIPYRDRHGHLTKWLAAFSKYYPYKKEILVIEQADDKPFNRGKLLNIGAIYSAGSHLVFHDVDMIPAHGRHYKDGYQEAQGVTQLAKSNIQLNDYLGGVTMFDSDTFFAVGGYTNKFFSRAEDNECRFNLYRHNIPVVNRFMPFIEMKHKRPHVEFDPKLWAKAQLPRIMDGVTNCKFELIEILDKIGYRLIRVYL